MIIITSPDLPDTVPPKGSGGVIANITPNNNGASVPVSLTTGAPLENRAIASIPTYSDGVISVPLPEYVSTVSALNVGGEFYSLQLNSNEPGFRFNPLTSELTVTLKPGHLPPIGSSVLYVYQAANYPVEIAPTQRVNVALPDAFTRWNVSESFELTRSFEGQPSAQFSFVAPASAQGSVRSTFAPGTKFDIMGRGYSVETIQIDRLSRVTYPRGAIAVTVGLTGKHKKELEAEITLVEDSQNNSDPNDPTNTGGGAGGGSLAEQQARCEAGRTNLSSLTNRAGTQYQGANLDVPTDPDEPTTSTTTLDQVLKDNARATGGFVFYSDPGGPQIRPFGGTTVHFLSDADVKSASIQLGGIGSKYKDTNNPSPYDDDDGVQLSDELDNTEIELDQDPTETRKRAARNVIEVKVKGDPAPQIAPSDVSLRETSAAFDMGGRTKTQTVETLFNGETLTIESVTYGFVFSSIDTYEIRNFKPVYKGDIDGLFNPTGYWRIVERKTQYRDFNGVGDYLIQEPVRGFRLARYKQEQNLDAVTLQASLSRDLQTGVDPVELKRRQEEIKLYTTFEQLPINANTTHELVNLRRFFPDIKQEEGDRTWVEPKFASVSETIDQSKIIRDDPTSTDEDPKPPISTGKNFFQKVIRDVSYPNPDIREEDFAAELSSYSVRTITSNSEGPLLRNSLSIEEREDFGGRPQIQPRLRKVSPDPCYTNAAPPKTQAKKFIVNTPGASSTKKNTARRTVQRFNGAFDAARAQKAMETDLAIANSRNVEQLELVVTPNRSYSEGDLILYQATLYVVFGVSEPYTIQASVNGLPVITSDGFRIQAGRLVRVPVTITPIY